MCIHSVSHMHSLQTADVDMCAPSLSRGVQLPAASALLNTGRMTRSSKSAHHSDSCTGAPAPGLLLSSSLRMVHALVEDHVSDDDSIWVSPWRLEQV